MAYSQTIYVKATGSDTTGNGTSVAPYATIAYALTKVTTTTPLINLGEGVYSVSSLGSGMSLSGKTITYIGQSDKTAIETQNSSTGYSWVGNVNIYNCIIRAANVFNGDTRVLSYTSDTMTVNFYNVCFTKSLNGTYPTSGYFYTNSSGPSQQNKNFYYCTFYHDLAICAAGLATLYTCAIKSTTVPSGNTAINNCKLGCLFNTTYQIVNASGTVISDNGLYGIYYGEFSWTRLVLIKYNNQYYSILSQYYDTVSKTYLPVTTLDFVAQAFPISDLFVDVTLGGETFKPITKFNNFQLIIDQANKNFNLLGTKTAKQMIVATDDIPTSIASNIDSFTLTSSASSNADIRIAFSIDKGSTWNTINSTTGLVETLSVTIPKMNYNQMSVSEKADWNAAKDTININGIQPSAFNAFNFNTLNAENIRFAYVLRRDAYVEVSETYGLTWQFDAKGALRMMIPGTEYITDVYEHQIKLQTLISNPIIKVNLMV